MRFSVGLLLFTYFFLCMHEICVQARGIWVSVILKRKQNFTHCMNQKTIFNLVLLRMSPSRRQEYAYDAKPCMVYLGPCPRMMHSVLDTRSATTQLSSYMLYVFCNFGVIFHPQVVYYGCYWLPGDLPPLVHSASRSELIYRLIAG